MGDFFAKILGGIWALIEVFVIALAMFVVVYIFLFQPHQVKGSSMVPNFHDEELILTDKLSYKLHPPRRGDVVVFKSPQNEEVDFIKRVIGLPGERVKIMQGKVYLNGEVLKEDYIPQNFYTAAGVAMPEGQEIIVPDEEILAFGDNRGRSSDSREWGPVRYANIVGRAFLRYWPVSQLGLMKSPKY